MKKKRCLLICYTNLAADPRVIKHFEALKENFDVITAGIAPIGQEKIFIKIKEYNFWDQFNKLSDKNGFLRVLFFVFVGLSNFLRFKVFCRLYFLRYWNIKRIIDFIKLSQLKNIDLIVANDLNTLPLAATLAKKNSVLVYDAHEYHAEEYAERQFWVSYNRPLIKYLYNRYISRVNTCITVGENIAKLYEKDYNKPFAVIYNTTPYSEVVLSKVHSGKIKMVYSGMFGRNRNVDEVIKSLDYLPANYELNLLITNVTDELRHMVNNSASKERIKFLKRSMRIFLSKRNRNLKKLLWL